MPSAMDEQFRTISLSKPERRRVRPPKVLNAGPAAVSSHARHGFRAQVGGGPLFGATRLDTQAIKHADPS